MLRERERERERERKEAKIYLCASQAAAALECFGAELGPFS